MESHLVRGNSLQQLELTDSGPTARNLTFVNIAPRKTTPCLAHNQESNNATDRFGRSCITSARGDKTPSPLSVECSWPGSLQVASSSLWCGVVHLLVDESQNTSTERAQHGQWSIAYMETSESSRNWTGW